MAGVYSRMPLLLEGPAAVGKTKLITSLGKLWKSDLVLERVNNTSTTTVQDYLGSYILESDPGFKYRHIVELAELFQHAGGGEGFHDRTALLAYLKQVVSQEGIDL